MIQFKKTIAICHDLEYNVRKIIGCKKKNYIALGEEEMVKYELTNPQKSIWYTEEFLKGTTVNNICTSGIIYGKIDLELLKKAINNVVKEHDSFRIHIVLENNVPYQYISDFKKFDIDTKYINTDKELKQIEEQEAVYKFNIIDSDLFKFKIVVLKDKFACVILTANHIICDSWSMGITIQEIMRNYNCLKNSANTDIQNFSYAHYINNEIEYKNSKKYENDKKYWNEVFNTIPEVATIPSNFKHAQSVSYNAKRADFSINRDLAKKIESFCKDKHISPFNFFMAIYSIYIGRVSNLDDFVIGTPILNRINQRDKQTTGMFVNTAPVRVKVSDELSFANFSKDISQKMMGILRHQKYSYNSILEDLREKQENVPNLYDIVISYQITKAFDKKLGNYETKWTFSKCLANDMNIHIFDINDTGSLQISYDYLTDKYCYADIESLHARIVFMINQILSNNDVLLDDIEIVTEKEKNKILYDFNNTSTDYPKNETIVSLFEKQVEKTPDNTAIVFEGKKLSYKELNEKANSLAHYLKANGLKNNNIVSIFLDKSIESIVAILATLKCGCAYMPIDIDYPKERINYMINNSASKFILTVNKLKEKMSNYSNVYCIDLDNYELYKSNFNNLHISSNFDSLAYVMYTSGSTGKPKGVMVSNRNVVRLVKNTNFIKFEEHERILQTGSIVFDACTFEIWGALLNGFELYIIKKQDLLDPTLLEKNLAQNKITVLWVTAPLFNQLSEQNPKIFSTVRVLLTGGDVLSPSHINSVRKSCPNLTIINGYGPTENTTFSACFTIDRDYDTSIPIGFPIANSTCYVVSKNMQILPVGVPGELLVGGDGVSLGYLGDDKKTKSKFIPNPFGEGTLYKTGDLVKWCKDGSIDFIGRIDNQVKVRGFRVELSEVNLAILKFDGIKECFSVVKDINNEKLICTYFSSNSKIDVKSLRTFLKKQLPHYAVPSYFVELDVLPINANGKIDKNRLPEPQLENSKKDIILPRNDIDAKLIDLLKSLLNVNNISIDDDFFELGGDSLSAINFCSQVQSAFDVGVFVKDIMEHPIVQDLSDIISNNLGKTKQDTIPVVPKAKYYPLSSAQKRIYLTCQMAGNNSTLYNVPGGIILDGNIDTTKLENCINTIISRHEVFRTYFETIDDKIVQKIIDSFHFNLEIVENCSFENINSIFIDFIKPFDLKVAPLFRAKFIKFANKKSALLVDMHHIISDGTSLAIFTDELCKLYNNETLPELKITYKDYATFENNRFENSKEAENYWLKQFEDDIPVLNMQTTYPRPAVQSFEGKKIHSTIDADTSKKIEQISKNLGITPYMFFLGCYYILLAKYTSQDDIVVGSPIVGRDFADTYNLIGMFVNTLALRNKVDCSLSFKDFVLKLKQNMLDAYKYETYPFDELVNKLNIKRDTGRNPLFDTMFIYQNNGFKEFNLENIKAEYYIPDTNISKFDLSLEVIPHNDYFALNFEYCTSLFNESFISDFAEHYLNILNCILANVDIKISNIDMLSLEEKNKILYDFNSTAREYPKDKTIINLFEEQAEKTPDDIAIVFEEQELTYRELNEKANSLANFLMDKGLKENEFVSIFLDKSLESIIAILATLKCRCAYMPIDIDYPIERIQYMINDSSSRFILTVSNLKTKLSDFSNVFCIDLSNTDIYNNNTNNLSIKSNFDDLAYLMYTSGSTGKPKGVMVSNRNVVRLVKNTNFIKFEEHERILQTGSIVFDACTFEIWGALLNGFELYIIKKQDLLDPILLEKYLAQNKITVLWVTAPLFNQLSEQNPKIFSTVRVLLTGGDVLSPSHINSVRKSCPNLTIINGYGPTENTTFSACFTIDKDYDSSVPIGFPIANSTCYVVSKDMQLLPVGIPGELLVGGDGVSHGYLGDNEKTKSKFIQNPFGGGILYKTGDLVKWRDDGSIDFIGRMDNQVKVRGFRVEFSEINLAILKFDGIKECFSIVEEINNEKVICSYFSSNTKIDILSLRNFLKDFLPYYAIPKYFIFLKALPINANGKVDKSKLSLPSGISSINKENFVAPETKLQKQLVDIWEKILNIKNIGINDNFFDLGGDSLLAMNLNIELLKITDKVSYSDIFRFPTISEMSKFIDADNYEPLFDKIANLPENFVDILDKSTKKEKLKKYHPNNLLLTGSTGFLGIHILEAFIKNEKGKVFCIVRAKKGVSPEKRLLQKLNYYFENKYDDLIGNRIIAIDGDTSKPNFGLDNETLLEISKSVDIVVNSAAIVSHYGNYSNFYNTNVQSVKYIVDFCKTFNKKLYHISTRSVAGRELDLSYLSSRKKKHYKIKFNESSLYVGQILNSVYSRSKFEAESCILNAMNSGLDAYILRMGNLMPRYSDGVFQENAQDNNFMNKIASYIRLGIIPEYILNYKLEFTPVDYAATAIIRLIQYPSTTNRIFHLYNHKIIFIHKLLKNIRKLGYNINILSEDEFKKEINLILKDENSKHLLNYLIDDFDSNFHLIYQSDILVNSNFTVKYLKKAHFRWPKITNKYLINVINILRKVI